MNQKAIIVIPTYNEVENIVEMVQTIRSVPVQYQIDILVVDSNSPDGTGQKLETMRTAEAGLYVLHQPRKMGLGRAYLDGFRFLRENRLGPYEVVITMDADFSHHPRYLPMVFEKLGQCDLVVGSRYVDGGKLENWPKRRKWLSCFGNAYAKFLTGIGLNDLTSGFHGFKTQGLQKVLSHTISADGYAFLIELKVFAAREGLIIAEIPIVFTDRRKGSSKISKLVILEAAYVVLKIFFQRVFSFSR